MDPYDLPEEFSHLQAQDMSKLGFMQDLIRGIKKIAQTEEPKPIAVQEAAAPVGNSAAVQLLKRGNMALEDGDWARADEFFEQALNADAELADAYLGKFFAEQEAENADAFVSARLNEAKAADAVKKVVSSVNECIDALAAAYRVEHYLEAAEIKARFKDFDNSYFSTLEAIQELFREAEELFASDRLLLRTKQCGEYKDSANFLAECWYESAESAFNAKEYKDAIYAFNQAGYYEDAADRILECWYAYADLNLASGDYKGAIDAFKKAGSYQDAAERINQIVQTSMCAFWSQICRIQIECEIEYTIEETPSKCPKYLGKMNMRTNSKTVLEGSSPSAPFMSSRTLYRSRRLFFCKAIGSFTPPPLLSTKSHAGCGCSLAGALTPPSRRTGFKSPSNL